ncbi:MAG TPA: preprotein translocase subunit YajC [Dermatophilaceae bacterium]|jgi:preprotein translocase subunit YajC|nr:preprotein translocase subunit YajC [Dermatophilaceae bacterium]
MTGAALGNLLILALPLLLIAFLVMTQRRRQRATAELQSALAVGDEVCTTSGLFGKIVELDDKVATLEVSPGTRLRFDRRAIGIKQNLTPPSPSGAGE